jgi:hypothetical protein
VATAYFLLVGEEVIISLSLVVNPAFVNKEITWNLAFSLVKPVVLKRIVYISMREMYRMMKSIVRMSAIVMVI